MNRLEKLIHQFEHTRTYTQRVLEQTDRGRWTELVSLDGVNGTHIAWQVGHLAVCEAYLLWGILLGRDETQLNALPAEYGPLFNKGVQPANPSEQWIYPDPEALLAVMDAVHAEVMPHVSAVDDGMLDEPPHRKHWAMTTREDALWWAIRHESLHTGHIGLCRRMLGQSPWR